MWVLHGGLFSSFFDAKEHISPQARRTAMSPVPPTKSDQLSPPDPSHELLHQTSTTNSRTAPRLLIQPVVPLQRMPTTSPTSPHSIQFPYSPIPPDSPINPFLIPPRPRMITTALFRIAAPLLPASPLSIFDRAISPTSLGAAPSPISPSYQPRMVHKDTFEDLTPSFMWPRTPPGVPQRIRKNSRLASSEMNCEDQEVSPEGSAAVNSCVEIDATEHVDAMVSQRSKMRLEFNCVSAADRATAMDQSSSPPSPESSKTHSAKKSWKKLFPKSKGTGKELVSNRRSV